ncbi:beta-eliminating lyase-related protein [Candidatus Tisiphia endosymbiont of Beris chalybata]|uniref:beta-eliminating lyase-related protein n=1 Tax=Candidatus Tisiphia endosymbiont of Beris chalybata TaxID=3066262 RepID=UPI003977B67B
MQQTGIQNSYGCDEYARGLLNELKTITEVAKKYDLPIHMDGARFANSIVKLKSLSCRYNLEIRNRCYEFWGHKKRMFKCRSYCIF